MNRMRLPGPSTAILLACTLTCTADTRGGLPDGTVAGRPGCSCNVDALPAHVSPRAFPAGDPAMPWPAPTNPYYRPLPPVAPPPGTLGRTYQLRSRPVPVSKHPRVAMIDVRVANAVNVTVRGTNDYRGEDTLEGFQDEQDPSLWRFESKPLIPGLPHIYEVDVESITPEGTRTRTLYVRLIMGRIVELKL